MARSAWGTEVETLSQPSGSVSSSIARPALGLSATLGIVAFGEFAREIAVARLYGAGFASDAYYLGIAIPLMIKGGLQTLAAQVIMPWFCQCSREDEGLGRAYMSRMFFLLLFPIAAAALVSGAVASLIAPVIAGPSIDVAMVTTVLALALPALALAAETAMLSAYMHSREVYSPVALRSLVGSVCFILGVAVLRSTRPAVALGLAFLVGSAAELAWLLLLARPSLRRAQSAAGLRWRPLWRLTVKSALPSAALALRQIGSVAERVMAGYLGVGSVAIFSYGSRMALGVGKVFTEGLHTVVRAKTSRAQARNAQEETGAILSAGARQMLLLMVPTAAFLFVLRAPISTVLFAGREFDAAAVQRTAGVIAAFGISLPAYGLAPLLLTAFYASGDVVAPSLHIVLMLVINLGLAFVAAHVGGLEGIAIAYAVTLALSTLRAAWLVERRGVRLSIWRDLRFFGQLAVGALGCAVGFWVAFATIGPSLPSTGLGAVLAVGASGAAGASAFVGLEILMGVPELRAALRWICGRITPGRSPT